MKVKNIDFITTVTQVIQIKKISNISILLSDGSKIELQNVALAPECNLSFISLG